MALNNNPSIKAPIIIVSAPRSGSTLLFETLVKHPDLYSIGGESHALIEHIPQLSTVARGYVSNALYAEDASYEVTSTLTKRFLDSARNSKGRPASDGQQAIRLLEKTPKNALRVGFLNTVFADAKFVYLVRDPRENISSIMQAWRSKRFVTYPNLPGWKGNWSLLLPDGWQNFVDQPLQAVARFQWQQANERIMQALEQVSEDRKLLISYQQFVQDPLAITTKILQFAQLDTHCAPDMLRGGLALSRYTLSPPQKNKWHANAKQLADQMAHIDSTVESINHLLDKQGSATISHHIDRKLIDKSQGLEITLPGENKQSKETFDISKAKVSRNAPCPCGSGIKYRQCHGKLK